MSHAPSLRRTLWALLLGWAGASGCIHNHYYGALPGGCPPGTQVVTTQVGPVCEVPAEPGSMVDFGRARNSSVVVQAPRSGATGHLDPRQRFPGRDQPARLPALLRREHDQSVRRFEKWRHPDPESVATLRSEGSLDDGTIKK